MSTHFQFNPRYPSINRKHAGGQGISRHRLPNFLRIGSFQQDLIDACIKVFHESGESYNDIGNAQTYKMSMESPLCKYFPMSYRQILLQRPINDGENETDYVVDHHIQPLGLLRQSFPVPFYRARIAVLPKDEVLDWHIDTDTSVSCRVQFPLVGTAKWLIKRRAQVEEKILSPGEIWFTNAGLPHRVENLFGEDRLVLTVGCSYVDLEAYLSKKGICLQEK